MKRKKNYYTVICMGLGITLSAALSVLLFVLLKNPLWLCFSGLGAAAGAAVGYALDKNKNIKEDNKNTEGK